MYKVDFPNWPTLFASSLKGEAALDNGDEAKDPLAIVLAEEGISERGEQLQNATTDTFSIIEQVDHDASSFTQGLSYGHDNDGKLCIYETTGLWGQSKVRRIDPDTFAVVASVDIDSAHFGEGSTFYTDTDGKRRLIEITWKKQTGFIYDVDTLEQLREFSYTTTAPGHEGWGITYDASAQEFIVSDGSANLYFWDRDTLAEKRSVRVTRLDGMEQDQLNELEYMDGLVCCNIWYSDDIICVDPESGNSVREYDMSSLWPTDQRSAGADVLNGIALGTDHVLITGKLWDRMYKVDFPNWPTLFASRLNDEVTPGNEDTQPLNEDRGGYIGKGDDMAVMSYN
eukprot:CAMPEP_0201652268 /NCGR_PEP_ID=MMETSP0493-20130528/44392_1 /ASSEMBLY_ACC=CAM_ASM_000838 /TAXON_ID=420259 /ORGANISM="Thalassiosira gravida, Strain GMp14c1" /LENGTH=340 /DNA_ID=CAMNT_0048128781 /DNA_START=1 /DNA_END=1023 /DNA_ORIENTATION=+